MPLLTKAYLGSTKLWADEKAWWRYATFGAPVGFGAPTLDAGGTANTKGAYTQAIASTSGDASIMVVAVGLTSSGGANNAVLLDIATGASGSETNIIENVGVGGAGSQPSVGYQQTIFQVPVKVPSGTRISARIQSIRTDENNCRVGISLFDAGNYATAPTSVDTYGADTSTSSSLGMSGASGSYVEVTSSTSQAYRGVVIVPCVQGSIIDAQTVNYKVAVGAAGSEVNFGALACGYTGAETVAVGHPYITLFGKDIPAGSRLAVSHDLTTTDARKPNYGVTIIGIP